MKSALVKAAAAGVFLLGGVGIATASATAANASTSAITVTASPSTGLSSGQTIQIGASGLTAGTTYYVNECAYVSDELACSEDAVAVTAGSDGTISSPLTVYSTFTAYNGSTVLGTVDCSTTQCLAGVGDAAGDGSGADISFSS